MILANKVIQLKDQKVLILCESYGRYFEQRIECKKRGRYQYGIILI